MYCKFCGNRIVPNANSKCTACGSRIDLYDGGQSFFKDAEIESWKSNGLSDGPDTGMPRTQIKEFEEEKKIVNTKKEEKTDPRPTKLSLKWIAGTIAFVLLVFGIVKLIENLGGKENEDVQSDKSAEVTTPGSDPESAVSKQIWKEVKDWWKEIQQDEKGEDIKKEIIATYTGDDVIVDEDGIALFNVKKFLWEVEDYKHEGPDLSDKNITKYEDRNKPEKIVIGVKRDSVQVYVGGTPKEMRTKNVLKNETFFVDAKTFLEVAFQYSCEFDPNTNTLTIYGK